MSIGEILGGITIQDAAAGLVALAAGIVAISNAWKLIQKHLHPESDLRPRVDRHDELLDSDNRRLRTLEDNQREMQKGISVLCQAQIAQFDHELSGNDTDHLRAARDNLNTYLTNR